ncbi:MAG: hypothetical protein KDK45_03590, partial [Leptospiraceae bacterium]|nr:hypothetical protein [Leptospiraceae bacterium]
MKQLLYLVLLILFSFISCSSSDSNKIELQVPELLNILSPDDAVIYLSTREIDSDLTPNCGTATPTTALSTGTTTTTTTTSSSSGDVSRYTIYSQLIMKQTKEVLTLKFIYDLNQFQGSIDSQQGFIFSSDLFQRTIIGKQGTVKWNSQGVGYIDSSNTGLQTLSYFDLELNLT